MLFVLLAFLVGCPFAPRTGPTDGLRLILDGLDSNRLLMVDVASGASRDLAPGLLADAIITASRSKARAYLRFRRPNGGARGLLAVNGSSGQVLWSKEATTYSFVESIALSPDEGSLIVCRATVGGVEGLGILDEATGNLTQFVANAPCRHVLVIAASARHPAGALVLLGRRDLAVQRSDSLFIMDLSTNAVTDSLRVPDTGRLVGWVGTPAGDALIFGTDLNLWKYDFNMKAMVAQARRPPLALGAITYSPTKNRLLLSESGVSFDVAGSGQVYEYDLSLRETRRVSLVGAVPEGTPAILGSVLESQDGRYLVLGTGTARRGPLFGVQPARVLILNASTYKLVKRLDLNDWGTPWAWPW